MKLEKTKLRKEIAVVRNSYPPKMLEQINAKVSSTLVAWEKFSSARVICGYLAYGNEINLDEVLQTALTQGKTVLVPLCLADNKMQMVPLASLQAVTLGKHEIRTANSTEYYSQLEKIDLVLTPGLAFTRAGGRLGLGKGYYDKFLAGCGQAVKIGVTTDAQLVESLPLEAHDVLLDYLVTQSGLIKCR